jgi:hypothetical protein
MKTTSRILVLVGLLLGSGVCAMADIQWTLSGGANTLTFADGAQATGTFTVDYTTGNVIADVNVTAATNPIAYPWAGAFTATLGHYENGELTLLYSGSYSNDLYLTFKVNLYATNSPVPINTLTTSESGSTVIEISAATNNSPFVTTPEPTAFAFLGGFGSLLGVGNFLRRKFAR